MGLETEGCMDRPKSLDLHQMYLLGIVMAHISESRDRLNQAANILSDLGYGDTVNRARALSHWSDTLATDLVSDAVFFMDMDD